MTAAPQERPPGRRGEVELRKNLLTVESIIKAEPQVLVFWEQGQGVRVMVHTLSGIAGLPGSSMPSLLKFGSLARCRVRRRS